MDPYSSLPRRRSTDPTDARFERLEADVKQLKERQSEHRAVLVGEGLEGNAGMLGRLQALSARLDKMIHRVNIGLAVVVGATLVSAPERIAGAIAFFSKLLKG